MTRVQSATRAAYRRRRTAARRAAPGRSTGNEMQALRQKYGVSQSLASRMLDVSLRTVSGLEMGSVPVDRFRRNVTEAQRLCRALGEVMNAGYVGAWLDMPNDMLGGLKPVEAIERGQIELVWQVVEGLRTGAQL